eukprot:scaffold92107_cov59-Phaeocystis_antarctica.AAC.3
MHGPGSERRAALTLRQIEARTAEVRRAAAPVGSIATPDEGARGGGCAGGGWPYHRMPRGVASSTRDRSPGRCSE